MCKVAAVLAKAAVANLVAAHVKLEVLLELADLGVLEGGGPDDMHQAPGSRGDTCTRSPQDPPIPEGPLLGQSARGEGLFYGPLDPDF